jgi:hypothetical protein
MIEWLLILIFFYSYRVHNDGKYLFTNISIGLSAFTNVNCQFNDILTTSCLQWL